MRTFVVLSNGVPAVAVDRRSERKGSGEEDEGYAETRFLQVRVGAEGGGLLNEEDHGRASCRGRDKGISWLSDRPYTGVIYEATEFRICQ